MHTGIAHNIHRRLTAYTNLSDTTIETIIHQLNHALLVNLEAEDIHVQNTAQEEAERDIARQDGYKDGHREGYYAALKDLRINYQEPTN